MTLNEKEADLKTAGELERQLTQGIRALHVSQLGHAPEKISCHLFGSQLAVVVEDSLLPVEQMFLRNGQQDLAETVRATINQLLGPPLIKLIQSILGVKVDTVLSNSCSGTHVTGIITILEQTPTVRNPEAIPKTKLFKKRRLREKNASKACK